MKIKKEWTWGGGAAVQANHSTGRNSGEEGPRGVASGARGQRDPSQDKEGPPAGCGEDFMVREIGSHR